VVEIPDKDCLSVERNGVFVASFLSV
jgi:hypothetical protein